MKPNGLALTLDGRGDLGMRVITPTKAEDAIWKAVETAIEEGMPLDKFRNEVLDAWEQKRKDDLKWEMQSW